MKIGHEIFELGRNFIGTKHLTKFHEDGTRNQMLTVGQTDIRRTKTGHKSSPEKSGELKIFELGRDFIGTKHLTKFHEDGTRNQILTVGRTDIRRTKTAIG
ncbi:hypothetical protein DPMN_159515 [Dreissena polymorpha]|uniref:Uncharacterized protein n=1 Tax=Dreissena polymorpha TaxID=45954 RepID=A0A9D4EKS2_DREPO|nr:hypothetical protein DPMN_159515 [Dreissena polymorpha]